MPVFEKLVSILRDTERDYGDNRKGIFYYIRSVAYAAERLCFQRFIPLLRELLQLPELAAAQESGFIEPSILTERHAYLRLMLYMALARCGEIDGYWGLCRLLKENRSLLRRSARDELHALTGYDHGFDVTAWENCIQQRLSCRKAKPWTARIK